MTIAEDEHQVFTNALQNPKFIKMIQQGHGFFQMTFRKLLSEAISTKEKTFIRWILKMSDKNFYIFMNQDRTIFLINKNLKSSCVLNFAIPNEEFKGITFLPKDTEKILEISNIHSLRKGEGKKIMRKLLEIKGRLGVPLTLWTETEDTVKYFERYGFVNHGPVGLANEFFMMIE